MKRAENGSKNKAYPLMPYLIGLFVTVIVLVLLSYLVQLRNKDELCINQFSECYIAESMSGDN